MCFLCLFFFFFNDTATTEIYTLSLHDALPISVCRCASMLRPAGNKPRRLQLADRDRKSTRLNSSHHFISYAVFCLKKRQDLNLRPSAPKAEALSTCATPLLHLEILRPSPAVLIAASRPGTTPTTFAALFCR